MSLDLLPGRIYVDPRVGSKEFGKPLQDRYAIRYSDKVVLPAGDFAWTCGHEEPSPFCDGDYGCKIAVERKTYTDLCGSLLKKRLDGHQVPDLLLNYTMSTILVEGVYRPCGDDMDSIEVLERGQWRRSRSALGYLALSSWLSRFTVGSKGRIAVWRVGSKIETTAWIASQFRWWQKPWKKHHLGSVDKFELPEKALLWKANDIERGLSSWPGVGIVNTKALFKKMLERKLAIEDVVKMGLEELRGLGIADARARKLYAYFRRVAR